MVRQIQGKAATPVPSAKPAQTAAPERTTSQPAPGFGADQLQRSTPATVVVAAGDTLSAIAERVLGDPNRWQELYEANRDRLRDPHMLSIGLELRLPGAASVPTPRPAPGPQDDQICRYDPKAGLWDTSLLEALDRSRQFVEGREVSYTVRRGDSLSRIALRELGDASRWDEILAANTDQLDRPEALQPGMVLKMPGDAKGVFKPRASELGEDAPVQSGQLWDLARQLGERHDLDPRLIMAVVMKESGGNPRARSPVGAKGLMQLMPGTARELGVSDVYDPRQNMDAGARYLKQQLRAFGDVKLALMAYNWGPGNVQDYVRGRARPPKETRDYVPGVLAYYRQFGGRA